jgi:hypothetical protein
MNRTTGILALTLTLAVAGPAMALAQQPPPAERMGHQQQRINQGVASGALTHHEAAVDEQHLRRDERLRARQKAADHGGPLTAGQRARDEHLLNNNSARIYNTKHNGVGAPPPR